MSTISIIGAGNMAAAIGTRAADHGHTVELMSRDASKARALADRIGPNATVGAYGTPPAGDIVFLAVLYAGAVDVATAYGDALEGKTVVEITNPFNADASGVVTTPGHSITQQVDEVTPKSTNVIKAFNTIFGGVLATKAPLDVFFAGGDPESRARVAAFLETLDMRPLDAGGLETTHALEWAAILIMGLAANGSGFGTSLGTK
ncbi:MAG TPA: NAD(P)-binding domain-containing protein [Microbacteriaceae bacterium]|nr:NAD(P)-binding domain-containing protein [Microbacteriaceae bacterium]